MSKSSALEEETLPNGNENGEEAKTIEKYETPGWTDEPLPDVEMDPEEFAALVATLAEENASENASGNASSK